MFAPHVNTMARPSLSAVGAIVRRHDPDRFLTALFAPAAHRETLFTLYAFNHELARAREAVREPFAAMIRLQWWREVVEGARRRHEVAGPLGEALDEGRLVAGDLVGMVDAREAEVGPIETVLEFEAYVRGMAGGVMVAAGRALGVIEPERLRDAGAAYGIAGVLRSVPALARQGRCVLPKEVLDDGRASVGDGRAAMEDRMGAVPEAAGRRLRAIGVAWLRSRPRVGREAVACVLPAVLAERDLRRMRVWKRRPFRDRLAVIYAGLSGRTGGVT